MSREHEGPACKCLILRNVLIQATDGRILSTQRSSGNRNIPRRLMPSVRVGAMRPMS